MAKKSPKGKLAKKKANKGSTSSPIGKVAEDQTDFSSADNDSEDDTAQSCLKCDKNVCPLDNALQCDRCHYWSHVGCVGVSKKAYETLCELKTTMWFCKGCYKQAKYDMEGISAVKTSMKSMKDELVAIKTELVKKNTTCVREQITEQIGEQTGDTVASNNNKTETKQDLEGKLESVIKEREEVEKRKKNIIIHGLPEKRANGTERSDAEALKETCRELLNITEVEATQLTRLGGKEPPKSYRERPTNSDRPWIRPLLVKLKDEDAKYTMLRANKELRNKETHVYITADLTPKQREVEKETRSKCKLFNEHNKDGDTEAYIQRGQMAFRTKKSRGR